MRWKTVLNHWAKGKPFKYPARIKKPFMWRTSRLDKNESLPYRKEFVIEKYLTDKQDFTDFKQYIKKSKNKYVVTFVNLSGDTLLIVPIPKRGKSFAHLKQFVDQASQTQQKEFWKMVAKICRKELKHKDHIWVSTHGLGVPYLHVRISSEPKHYGNSKMLKLK